MVQIALTGAHLLWITPEPELAIERAARTCYKSEDKITEGSARRMVGQLIDRGHEAMLEHAVASVVLVTDRGVTHELVRHRLAAYAQESTRYCDYGKDKFGGQITVILPPGLNIAQRMVWQFAMKTCEAAYQQLRRFKCTAQIARAVLPNSLKTEIVVTANLREWRHIFKMRLAKDAHPQIRHLMSFAWETLYPHAPTIFEQYRELAEDARLVYQSEGDEPKEG